MFLPSCILLVTKVKVGEYKKAFLILPLNLEICGMFPLFSPFSFDRQRVVDRRERYRQVRAFLNSGEEIRTFFYGFRNPIFFFLSDFLLASVDLHQNCIEDTENSESKNRYDYKNLLVMAMLELKIKFRSKLF